MKIKIKQVDWSGWNVGSTTENNLEYNVKLKKEIIVKSIEYTTVKKSIFQKSKFVEIVFSFKVIELDDNYVKLQTNGSAGGEYNKEKGKYLPKTYILKFDETMEFKTKTMDSGSSFYVSIEK